MFGNPFLALVIARIFDNADKEVRREIVDSHNPLEINERERVATLCTLIRLKISRYSYISSFSVQAHARDTIRRDALFVFRYKEKVKIGLVEVKLLKIKEANLAHFWDWGGQQSHFTAQVIEQQKWLNEAAVWDMFIPNCGIGEYAPPLQREGSSNIWSDEMIKSPQIKHPNQCWSYNDLLSASNQYLSLYDIIKAIYSCEKGKLHDVSDKREIVIKSSDGIEMEIPIPRVSGLSKFLMNKFFSNNNSIDSYNYYRFDNLFDAVKDYRSNRKMSSFTPEFRRILDESNDISLNNL